MTLQTLFVVNRAGGLIYSRELSPGGKLSGNEYLVLASTFHSLHAISKQLAPVPSGGITSVDAPSFSLHCLESPTGMKFFTTAKPNTRDVHGFLRKVYEFYADFVLKNPFYELDMPIRLRVRVPLRFARAHDSPSHILIRDCCVLTIVHLLPPVFLLISSLSTASRVTQSHSGSLVLRRRQWRLRYSPVRPVRRWWRCRHCIAPMLCCGWSLPLSTPGEQVSHDAQSPSSTPVSAFSIRARAPRRLRGRSLPRENSRGLRATDAKIPAFDLQSVKRQASRILKRIKREALTLNI
jgi:hypothetical protein